jgi:hypothetical protein
MVYSAKKRPLLPLVTKRELYDDMMRLMNVNGPHPSMLYDKSFDSRQPFTSDSYEAHFREMNILVYRMEAAWISNNQQILKEDYSDSNEMQTLLKRWENIIRVVSDGAFYIQIILDNQGRFRRCVLYSNHTCLQRHFNPLTLRFYWTQISRVPIYRRDEVIKMVMDVEFRGRQVERHD